MINVPDQAIHFRYVPLGANPGSSSAAPPVGPSQGDTGAAKVPALTVPRRRWGAETEGNER